MTPRFTYARVTDEPNQKRAVCRCGWSIQDTPEAVDAAVRLHRCYVSTSTGRMTTFEPNLQGIPVRTKEGKQIRDAFISGLSNLKPGERP